MAVEKQIDNEIMTLTLSGAKGNSFSVELLEDLHSKLSEVKDDDSIVGIVLTGAGKVFSVGGNVFAMHEALTKEGAHLYLDSLVAVIEKVIIQVVTYPKPIVAAVNGAAAGAGMSLALACDDLVTVDHAKFGMAFGGLGLSPDSGSSVIFVEHFGRKETIEGIATAKVFSASEIEERGIGIITQPDKLLEEAAALVRHKTSVSPYSYGKTKLLVNQDLARRLEHNLPMEYQTISEAAKRDEFREKVDAMIGRMRK